MFEYVPQWLLIDIEAVDLERPWMAILRYRFEFLQAKLSSAQNVLQKL